MKTGVIVTNDDGTISIEKKSENVTYRLTNEDGQVIWYTEKELRELKWMIEEVLQIVHKNDYEN